MDPDERHGGETEAEQAASNARLALRRSGIVPIEPDATVAVMLQPGEPLLAARRAAQLERQPAESRSASPRVGDLYLTDRRLIHLGTPCTDLPLDAIREAEATDEWLLLRISGAEGLRIRVADPRVLRVAIAAARTAGRSR
ncbi:MAG TPA: hypothetical protein VFY23_01455 [Candidatus Limnocylindrales bacterium]|nr:hypothetical protein [Candidatus Limnocylindrales bacterium]